MNKIGIYFILASSAALIMFLSPVFAGADAAGNGFTISASPSALSEYDVTVEGPLPVVYVFVTTGATGNTRFEKPEILKTGSGYKWVFRLPPAPSGEFAISFGAKDPYYPVDVNERPEIIYVSATFGVAGAPEAKTGESVKDNRSELQKLRDAVEASGAKRGGRYSAYPRPRNDNRFGIHWHPTLSQSREEVDRCLSKVKDMGIKWVVFLNGNDDLESNRYLVERLVSNGIMPVMRIYYPAIVPAGNDELKMLKKIVKQYVSMGVPYFQVFNEPNLECEWEGKKFPENSVKLFTDAFVPRAKAVLEAGGIPGIPGPAPGYYDTDKKLKAGSDYFKMMIDELIARGERGLAVKCFVALHNYATGRDPAEDVDSGFREFVKYNKIMAESGLDIPQLGCEGGTRPEDTGGDLDKMADWVIHGYEAMKDAPDYFLCFSPWLLAAPAGDGWENHAWIKHDGRELPVVKKMTELKKR
jgi:hypothetical protein